MTPPNPVDRPPEFLTLDVLSGDSIGDISRRAVKLADAKKLPVRFTFQGVPLEAKEGDDPWTIGNFWFRNRDKKGSAS